MADDNGEEWRPVVGWEGYYEVSDLGRVKRVAPGPGTWAGRIIGATRRNHGYPYVNLCRDGEISRNLRVHRLVAEVFLPPPPSPKHEINHIDSDRANNRVANLEWVTRAENLQHASRAGRLPDQRGSAHPKSLLTDEDVAAIRSARGHETQQETGARFGISDTTVCSIQRGKSWKHTLDGDPPRSRSTGMNRGSRHGLAVLNEEKVREILRLRNILSQREIGERFGICQGHVSQIHRRVIWGHVAIESVERADV